MKHHALKTIMTFLFGMLLIIGCDNGTGPETPESATISGTITFTGTWPTDGDITVSLSAPWPPAGPPTAYELITEADLSSDNTYTYTFENITFSTYGGVSVAWEDPENDDDATNKYFLGASSGTYPYMETYGAGVDPDPITVSSTEYALSTVDISANLSYAVASGN